MPHEYNPAVYVVPEAPLMLLALLRVVEFPVSVDIVMAGDMVGKSLAEGAIVRATAEGERVIPGQV